ncbi:transposase [Neobacillus drentensis]|uniref:transposase n=1 Tax=Neobacillus drentensis TaxID=220684 RepID=UPI0028572818|nr:transposase [Neobacillus drentensis]MDR7239609.1 REP element-mobilizing transposase RayT [Neobacillus drentensis]
MVRSVRTWFQGAKYHVTSRGIRKSSLFFDEEDFEKYLTLVEETKERYPFILHTYCLMSNHTHLQIETKDTPLSLIMKNLNTKFAKYFNRKYHFSGHVFEKRYGDELLNSPEYEIDVSKYIHLNPVSAGMVANPEDYPWSSYRAFVYGESIPLIAPKALLSYFPDQSTQHYENYINLLPTDKFYWEDGKLNMLERKEETCGLK